MTTREEIATRILTALLSNPGTKPGQDKGNLTQDLCQVAVFMTDTLLDHLVETEK